MKILVTGGTGLVGTHLKKIIKEATYVSTKDYNLTSEIDVIKMYSDINPDCVIHAAAKVGGIIDNINHPVAYFDDNILMNTLLVKHAYLNNVKRFIGILSTCIYPDTASEYPLKESMLHDGPPTPTNFSYAYSKRALATQIDSYNTEFNTKYNYLIPCNLYGEGDKDGHNSHFVTALIKKIHEAKLNNSDHINLFGDGTPIRQFIHVSDLCNVIKYVIDNDIYDSFNVATNEIYTIKQIAELAIRETVPNLKINWDTKKPNGQYRKDVCIDFMNKNIKCELTKLKDGIKKYTINYEKVSI